MKVLMITGDKNFKPGHERYELQKAAVDELAVVYWGRGSLWPKLPAGAFTVVTVQDPFWRGLFGMFAAKRLRAKFNVQVHTDLSAQSGLRRMLAQIVLRHAHSVRVVSQKIKQQVLAKKIRAKVTVLPVFVDIERFKNVSPKMHEGKNILWLGRFEAEKDPLLAIEVFKKVWKSEADSKLIMLGSGSLGQELRTQSAHLPVEVPGWHDPAEYFAVADVVLCTSRHESWGASMVEALAAGVPVVAPDVGIAKEAGALVVERGDLARQVLHVLQTGERGTLQLPYITKKEWAAAWKHSLL